MDTRSTRAENAQKTAGAVRGSKNAVKDLTTGEPMKLILGFALPLLGGLLFQQLYGMVDTMIVGRTLGKDALAGVGSTGSINFLILGFCMGTAAGFAIPVSQRFGAHDYKGMRRMVAHAIYVSILFSAIVTVVVTILTGPILTGMRTPENIYGYAYDYIFIIFLGIPAVYLYNLSSSVIRALGDSKAPVVFLIIASVTNIVLDLVFILNFHMGVAGAAWATNVSQLFSGVLCLVYIRKKIPLLRFERDEFRPEMHIIGILFSMGVPMGLQYSITAIGSVILQTAVNGLGSDAVATMTAASRVAGFFCIPFDALGTTMSTWGGQNLGAGRLGRLGDGLKDAAKIGVVYSLAALVILALFGRPLTTLFISGAETRILDDSAKFLVIQAAFFIPLLFVNIVRFLIQGMGYSVLAVFAGVFELVGRAGAAFLLVPYFGFTGACFASPIAWVLADAFLFPAYYHCLRKTYRHMGFVEDVHGLFGTQR